MDGAHEVLGAGGIQRREPVGGSAKGIPRHMRSHCRRYRALALPSSQRWLGRCCFGESEGWPGIHVRVGVLRRPSLLTLRDAPLSVADGLSPAAGCVPRPLAECLAAACWWWLGPRSCIAGRSIAGSQCRRRAGAAGADRRRADAHPPRDTIDSGLALLRSPGWMCVAIAYKQPFLAKIQESAKQELSSR
jgi:hypothetical protein